MFFINQIKYVFKGIIIGGGMILPGVSGSVLAVIMGVYEKIINAFANLSKDFKKNAIFLAPILIGLVAGFIIFGKLLFFFFGNYENQSKYVFMGLIIGGLPAIYKEAIKKKEKKLNLYAFFGALIFSLILFVFGKNTFNIDFSANLNSGLFSYFLIFIAGLIYITGKIVPGISSSFMLMLIGMYQFLLNILNDPLGLSGQEAIQIIPFVLGMIVGGMILVKVIRYLFKNYYIITYSVIVGFVIGSVAAIYPGFTFDLNGLIYIILFILSTFISYQFSRISKE